MWILRGRSLTQCGPQQAVKVGFNCMQKEQNQRWTSVGNPPTLPLVGLNGSPFESSARLANCRLLRGAPRACVATAHSGRPRTLMKCAGLPSLPLLLSPGSPVPLKRLWSQSWCGYTALFCEAEQNQLPPAQGGALCLCLSLLSPLHQDLTGNVPLLFWPVSLFLIWEQQERKTWNRTDQGKEKMADELLTRWVFSLLQVALIAINIFHTREKAGRLGIPPVPPLIICLSCVELRSKSEFQMISCLICIRCYVEPN